jgi:hypothetical protein
VVAVVGLGRMGEALAAFARLDAEAGAQTRELAAAAG